MHETEEFNVRLDSVIPKVDPKPFVLPSDLMALGATAIKLEAITDSAGNQVIDLNDLVEPGVYEIWTDPEKRSFSNGDVDVVKSENDWNDHVGSRGLLIVAKVPVDPKDTTVFGLSQTYITNLSGDNMITLQRCAYNTTPAPMWPHGVSWQSWYEQGSSKSYRQMKLNMKRGFVIYDPEQNGSGHLDDKDDLNNLLHSTGTYTMDMYGYMDPPKNLPPELYNNPESYDAARSWVLYYMKHSQLVVSSVGIFIRYAPSHDTWEEWVNLTKPPIPEQAPVSPASLPTDICVLGLNENVIRPPAIIKNSKEVIDLEAILEPGVYEIWTDPERFSSNDISAANKIHAGSDNYKLGARGRLEVIQLPVDPTTMENCGGILQRYTVVANHPNYTVTFSRSQRKDATSQYFGEWSMVEDTLFQYTVNMQVQRGFLINDTDFYNSGTLDESDDLNDLATHHGTYVMRGQDYMNDPYYGGPPKNLPEGVTNQYPDTWVFYYTKFFQMVCAKEGIFMRHTPWNVTPGPWKKILE